MTALLPFALRHWKLLASVVTLSLALTWGAIGWNRAGHWKRAYQSEKAAYATFRTAIVDRTAEALAAQNAANAAYKEKTNEWPAAGLADTEIGSIRLHQLPVRNLWG
ncbi:MAG: hypothetical protein DI537_34635, partial [Stutzerimonas stutzeri]